MRNEIRCHKFIIISLLCQTKKKDSLTIISALDDEAIERKTERKKYTRIKLRYLFEAVAILISQQQQKQQKNMTEQFRSQKAL